ncbi:MAG: hypothetical protein Q8N84_03830 [bacterium]|nr:hypothetical protein [bacterium]
MMTKRLLWLLLVAVLFSACATPTATTSPAPKAAPSTTAVEQPKEDPLKERAHVNISFQKLTVDNPTWGEPLKYAGLLALIVALLCLLTGERGVMRWAVIMALVLLWGVIADAVLQGIRNAWPEALTQKLIEETIGWGAGILPSGDINPVGGNLAKWTVDLIAVFLKVSHGLICWWFFLMPIPWLLENILAWRIGSTRLQISMLGIWFGMFYYRLKLPSILAEETLKLHRQKIEVVTSIPGVKEIGEALLNTILGTAKGINLNFAGVWWGYTFGLLFVFSLLAVAVSIVAAPVVVGGFGKARRTAGRLRREFTSPSSRGREAARGSSEETQRLARRVEHLEGRNTASDAATQRYTGATESHEPPPPGYVVRKDSGLVVPERYAQPRAQTQNQGLGGNQKPGSGKDSRSGSSTSGLRGTAQKAGKTLADLGSGGLASKATVDPGAVLQTAGGVATVAGHPEAGVPLAVAGTAVSARTNQSAALRQQSPGPNQDPEIAAYQATVNEALTDFVEGSGEEA